MGFKRRRKSLKGRSRKRLRRTVRARYNMMSSSRAPLARTFNTKLRYCESVSLDAGVGTPATHIFSANNIYDPNYTGVGHQPLGHDELANLYDHYMVKGAKMTISASTSSGAHVVGILVKDNANAITDFDSIQEQPENNFIMISANQGPRKISRKVSVAKFFNRNLKGDDRLQASFGAAPADGVYFHVWTKSTQSGGDPGSIDIVVTLDYIVNVSEPKSLAGS